MIALVMVVLEELRDGAPEMPLPQRNQPIETFFIYRLHETFCVGIRILAVIRKYDRPMAAGHRCGTGDTLALSGTVGGDHVIYVDFKQRFDLEPNPQAMRGQARMSWRI